MGLRTINFYDGYTSSTNPDITQVDVNSVVIYADDASFEADYSLEAGSMYYNTTINQIKYYNGTEWKAIADESDLAAHTGDASIHFTEASIDHNSILNNGSVSHGDLDEHVIDTSIHYQESAIDHASIQNVGNNSHADIDIHISDTTIHFTEGSIDHTAITNIGTNSHADIDTHIGNTAAHGTSGTVVGTSDAQTFTNKKFDDALTFKEVATPSNPSSGYRTIYPKNDGKFYQLTSAGEEKELGSSAGGSIDFLSEKKITDWAVYNDGAVSIPVDGTGGTASYVTVTQETSSPISSYLSDLSIKISKSANNAKGEGASIAFSTRGEIDRAAIQRVTVQVKSSTNYVDKDVVVWIYDVTNSRLISPEDPDLYASSFVSNQFFSFQTSPDSDSYRLIFHVASTNANAYELTAVVKVGPSSIARGAVVTDWESYTPVWTAGSSNPTLGNGTITGLWGRSGKNIEGTLRLTVGSTTTFGSGTYYFSIPSEYSIDSIQSAKGVFGYAYIFNNNLRSTNTFAGVIPLSNTNTFRLDFFPGGGSVAQGSPITLEDGDVIVINYKIPILGWSSNTVMSSDAGNREIVATIDWTGGTITNNSFVTLSSSNTTMHIAADTTASYNASTGEYLVPETGFYDISIYGQNNSMITTANLQFIIRVNGDVIRYGGYDNGTSSGAISSKSSFIGLPLQKNQIVTFQYYFSHTTTSTWGTNTNHLSIAKRSSPQTIAASEKVIEQFKSDTAQAISGSATTMVHEDKIISTHGAYNPSTGVFTAPKAGILKVFYQFDTASVTLTASQFIIFRIYDTARDIYIGYIRVFGTGAASVYIGNGSGGTYVNKGDTLRLEAAASVVTSRSTTNITNNISYIME